MATERAKTLQPQDEVSHYRILSPLGAGGMGEVYIAQDQTLERNVALKILPPDLVRNEERVRRFMLEAKSASSLNHPNIVTIYEIGQAEVRSPGQPASAPVHFISMELVRGKTLSTLIHDDRTDLRTLLGYLAQAAEGLAKAHASGIVHRDLKPGNIMVSADGFTKVLDFGLAKLIEKRAIDSDSSSTPTLAQAGTEEGMIMGTAGYMSPEQVRGQTVDHRADIFSFGCILYEAATRKRPFYAETGVETMHKILNEKPAPVEELNAKAPAELRRLIRRCLAKSPDQRLQSMKDLSIELREIVEDYDQLSASASSGGVSSASLQAPPARRFLSAPLVVIAASALLLATAGGWWVLQRGNPAPRTQPFQSMRMATQTSRGDLLDCALSPDGRLLAYLAGRTGQISLRVRQVATGSDVEVLPPTNAAMESPSFSPDSNYLFYLMRKADAQNYRYLYQVPSLGGSPQQRAFDVDSRISFSPDGKQVTFFRGVLQKHETHIIVLELESGKERILAKVSDAEAYRGGPCWSPDGRQIVAAFLTPVEGLQSVIDLFDAGTGNRQRLAVLPKAQIEDVTWLRDGTGLAIALMDLKAGLARQLFLVGYPGGGVERLTNDFNDYMKVSAASGDATIASIRRSSLGNIWLADASGAAPRQVTRSTNTENSPSQVAAGDGNRLFFAVPRDQALHIWSLKLPDGEPQPLTSGQSMSFAPQIGSGRIFFDRIDPTGIHVWSMNLDGTGQRQLSSGVGEQTRGVSRDGRFLAVSHLDARNAISLISVENGRSYEVSQNYRGFLGFSSDGQRMLLAQFEQAPDGLSRVTWQVLPVPEGAPVASLRLPGSAIFPAWSADGRSMLFQDAADPALNIQKQDFGSNSAVPVTHFTDGRINRFLMSPDGKKLAVSRRVGPAENVWITESDGSRPIQVTQFTFEEVLELAWMPDSHGLAVGAGTRNRDAVLIRNFR